MRVPACNEIAGRCICCGIDITHKKSHENDCVNIASWIGGISATALGRDTSEHNGRAFVIHICDDCLKRAENCKRVHCFYNSLNSEKLPIPDQDAPVFNYYEFDLTLNEESKNASYKSNKAK